MLRPNILQRLHDTVVADPTRLLSYEEDADLALAELRSNRAYYMSTDAAYVIGMLNDDCLLQTLPINEIKPLVTYSTYIARLEPSPFNAQLRQEMMKPRILVSQITL